MMDWKQVLMYLVLILSITTCCVVVVESIKTIEQSHFDSLNFYNNSCSYYGENPKLADICVQYMSKEVR
jgi:hypothetical protein